MSKVEKRTFSITTKQAEFIDRKIAEGVYASGSEIVREGLRAIKEREDRIDRWVVEEVVPAYDEWKKNPEDVRDIDDFHAELENEILAREAMSGSQKKAS
jgi:antitoxin ParD1/3/4